MNKTIEKFLTENKDTLDRLADFMLDYNTHTNLTRITDLDEIIEKHYIDSILPLTLHNVPRGTIVQGCESMWNFPRGTTCLDVGSGAGFPGIPMKLLCPELQMTLLDSAKKRTDYLKSLLEHIGVDCEVVTARSEELAHNPDYRERYGLVTARAVANLASLCEYCLPFVKPPVGSEQGGVFLAMKGSDAETAGTGKALEMLGGEIQNVIEYDLPSGDKRNLIVIKKVRQTPTNYPRKRVNITKNPIA